MSIHPKVKDYLSRLPSPQKEICEKLRTIIFTTFPDMEESFKNGVPWYEDNFYLVGLRDHVNMGFTVAGLTENDLKNFEGNGKIMRHIKFYGLEDVEEKRVKALMLLIR